MYVSRAGKVYVAPYGVEYLGDDSEGIPVVSGGSSVGRMSVVTPRSLGRTDA